MARASTSLVLLLLAIALPAPALAGAIHGRLQVPPVASDREAAPDPYAGRAGSLPHPRLPVRGLPQDAVIYVESVPPAVDSLLPTPERPRLAQQDQSFVPRVVVVPRSGTVDFPNMDPIYHNVFSVSPIRRFDLGRYGRGKSRSVTFRKTGLVNVYCDIHSNMEGFILVVPNRAFARPDSSGRYSLPDLPPGRYSLVLWHPDLGTVRRDVSVPDHGDVTVDLGFAP